MLIQISRTLFWLAAACAVAALAAPERAGTWLTALAGATLLGSFAFWRVAAARRRAEETQAEAIEMAQLADVSALETAARLARAIAQADGLDAALLAALAVLRSELGCRDASAHRVMALEPPLARLVTLIDAGGAGRGVEHRVRLEREPLGVALRDGRVVGRDAGPFAVPVLLDGRPVAALELGVIALDADPVVLAALLELAGLQLGEAARRAGAGAAQAAIAAASGQLMAGLSHEMRTPMNGILGMTELLLGTALDDRQRGFAEAVYQSGETLLETLHDLRDFATLESGQLVLAPTEFELPVLVEDTLERLAERAREKGLTLGFRAESGLPERVHGDPLRLRQILARLLTHAIGLTQRGEVVIDVRRAAAEAPAGPAASLLLEFDVRDTGAGIAAELQPRLFQPFGQADEALAPRRGGTGLGLAIARRLVELMGGRIEVRSAPGIGSEFRFTVPLQPLPGEAVQRAGADALSGLRVLLARDAPGNGRALENMLAAWGVEVVPAHDGAQALVCLRDDPRHFDLALIDAGIRRLDSLQLARTLRRAGLRPGMPLWLLAPVQAPQQEREGLEAGFDRVLAEPVHEVELRRALLGVTSSRADGRLPTIRLDKKVLVVEDNRVNQEVIGQMLRRFGCRVEVVSGAMEGLRALCEESFDLVLMDIEMPGMDGTEALRWFRTGGDGRFPFLTSRRTPVVAVTANALDDDERCLRDLGFDDYLSKPFRQSQLLAMLLRQLSPPSAALPGDDTPAEGAPAGARPQAATSLLDPVALDKLRELDPKGDNKLIERVMKAFETSVARLLPQLREAHRLGDQAGIRHVVHTLKASSASIGAQALSQQCAEIETRIRLGEPDGLDARIDVVYGELENVLKALRPWTDGTA